jgi:SepF-like predicted cell division protein (DUF552 family)
MAKKTTLADIATQMQKGFTSLDAKIDKLDERMERGFAAIADDIADVRSELKGDIARVQEQVNSIEAQLRETKIEVRLGKLEEEVFGAPRL